MTNTAEYKHRIEKATTTRQRRFKKAMQDQGLVRVECWVPADQAASLRQLAVVLASKDCLLQTWPLADRTSGRTMSLEEAYERQRRRATTGGMVARGMVT